MNKAYLVDLTFYIEKVELKVCVCVCVWLYTLCLECVMTMKKESVRVCRD